MRTACSRSPAPGSPPSKQVLPEDEPHRVREPLEHVGSVVVVHREHAAGGEPLTDRRHRLLREEVRLEPERPLAGDERERVGEREQDQVELLVGPFEEGAAVVDVRGHPGVAVRLLGVEVPADALEHRIDLDGVDRRGAFAQRDGDVVAVARTDDEHATGIAREVFVGPNVELLLQPLERQRRLVRERVHADRRAAVLLGEDAHPVVRRPRVAADEPADPEHGEERRRPDHAHGLAPQRPGTEGEEGRGQGESPPHRSRSEERQRREADDAEQAPEDVEAVGLERRETFEPTGDLLGHEGHRRGDAEEDDRQRDPHRRRRKAEHGLVLEVGDAPHDAEHRHDGADRGEGQRRPAAEVRVVPDAQEADADPEEAREQHEVREQGDVDLEPGNPSDQRELGEEHHGARDHERGAGSEGEHRWIVLPRPVHL